MWIICVSTGVKKLRAIQTERKTIYIYISIFYLLLYLEFSDEMEDVAMRKHLSGALGGEERQDYDANEMARLLRDIPPNMLSEDVLEIMRKDPKFSEFKSSAEEEIEKRRMVYLNPEFAAKKTIEKEKREMEKKNHENLGSKYDDLLGDIVTEDKKKGRGGDRPITIDLNKIGKDGKKENNAGEELIMGPKPSRRRRLERKWAKMDENRKLRAHFDKLRRDSFQRDGDFATHTRRQLMVGKMVQDALGDGIQYAFKRYNPQIDYTLKRVGFYIVKVEMNIDLTLATVYYVCYTRESKRVKITILKKKKEKKENFTIIIMIFFSY